MMLWVYSSMQNILHVIQQLQGFYTFASPGDGCAWTPEYIPQAPLP